VGVYNILAQINEMGLYKVRTDLKKDFLFSSAS